MGRNPKKWRKYVKRKKNVSPEFDLDKFANEAAEKAVAQYAMKQAELKAAEEKAKQKPLKKQLKLKLKKRLFKKLNRKNKNLVVQAGLTGAENWCLMLRKESMKSMKI